MPKFLVDYDVTFYDSASFLDWSKEQYVVIGSQQIVLTDVEGELDKKLSLYTKIPEKYRVLSEHIQKHYGKQGFKDKSIYFQIKQFERLEDVSYEGELIRRDE
ncbi:hypothetical protein [Thermoactinomyces sp. DSM 45892]|uniref:hypothetical protein n=1 Tax=Thermoactinomyces sp. DSM 45892 TaxID=1882753 RepID=UPI000898CDD6|nr:hypothetical protein [Thermoactinomyces sp. DSM 45892]SDX94452.1 hypothetical protein SAMN05444416_10170 [Thermoactinomyces sp. DSM 45892]